MHAFIRKTFVAVLDDFELQIHFGPISHKNDVTHWLLQHFKNVAKVRGCASSAAELFSTTFQTHYRANGPLEMTIKVVVISFK